MSERDRTYTPRSLEKERPVTLTLSSKQEQAGVFNCLFSGLREFTHREVNGWYGNTYRAEFIEEIDQVRKVTSQFVRDLGMQIDPHEAISRGLLDLLPQGKLEEMATWKNRNLRTRKWAKYFLAKEASKNQAS